MNRMFEAYATLAAARRDIADKLRVSSNANEREFLFGEQHRIASELGRLDAEIAKAAAIAIVG